MQSVLMFSFFVHPQTFLGLLFFFCVVLQFCSGYCDVPFYLILVLRVMAKLKLGPATVNVNTNLSCMDFQAALSDGKNFFDFLHLSPLKVSFLCVFKIRTIHSFSLFLFHSSFTPLDVVFVYSHDLTPIGVWRCASNTTLHFMCHNFAFKFHFYLTGAFELLSAGWCSGRWQ